MYCFCTYFDQNYASRGLALYRSLERHCPSFRLWVLCMDSRCYDILSQLHLKHMCLVRLEDFEKDDEGLLAAKQNRRRIEYYFTCTPSLPLFILSHWPDVDLVTYLDADLFFFGDPAPLYKESAGHSIAIMPHRFPTRFRYLEDLGIYNVGWLSFRRDRDGLGCLHRWRDQCLEWCHDRTENGRYADQKYLDDWPSRFQNVVVLQHKGANLAPWNLANYAIGVDHDAVSVDGEPLIFYHFQGFRQLAKVLFDTGLVPYESVPSSTVLHEIYDPYVRSLAASAHEMSAFSDHAVRLRSIRGHSSDARIAQDSHFLWLSGRFMRSPIRHLRTILSRQRFFFIRGHLLG